ncbi:hypothetical protein D3C86_2093520 [compost metagenome]
MLVSPQPRHSAHSQELTWAASAPAAAAAWKMITAELVKPTSTAIRPALTWLGAGKRDMGRSLGLE